MRSVRFVSTRKMCGNLIVTGKSLIKTNNIAHTPKPLSRIAIKFTRSNWQQTVVAATSKVADWVGKWPSITFGAVDGQPSAAPVSLCTKCRIWNNYMFLIKQVLSNLFFGLLHFWSGQKVHHGHRQHSRNHIASADVIFCTRVNFLRVYGKYLV